MSDSYERAERVASLDDLAAFVEALRADLLANADDWENPTLDRYLEALSAYIRDSPGWLANRGEPVPEQPSWRFVAQMLDGARLYE